MPNWLRRVLRWVNQLWKPNSKPSPPTVLKRYNRDADPKTGTPASLCFVLSLARQRKDAVATYRIVPKPGLGKMHYLLTLDELAPSTIGKYGGTTIRLREHVSPVSHSHGFSVWKIKEGSDVPALVGAWHVNLVSVKAVRAGLDAKTIILVTALQALRIKEIPGLSLSEQLETFNWLQTLEIAARTHLNNPHYQLNAIEIKQRNPQTSADNKKARPV